MTAVLQMASKLRRHLRELTGEARWDDYVAECRATGEQPMTRREFERRRDDEREHLAGGRCC